MPEQSHPLVQLAGSERAPLADVTPAGQLDTSERAELTLVLRRRAEIPADIVEGPTVLTSDQLAGAYVEQVPRRAGHQRVRAVAAQRPSEPGDAAAEEAARVGWRFLVPQRLDQRVDGDHLVGVEQQHRQQCALLRPPERELAPVVADLQGSKDSIPHVLPEARRQRTIT